MTDEHGADQPDASGASAPLDLLRPILTEAEALARARDIMGVVDGVPLGRQDAVSLLATHLLLAAKTGENHGINAALAAMREAKGGGGGAI